MTDQLVGRHVEVLERAGAQRRARAVDAQIAVEVAERRRRGVAVRPRRRPPARAGRRTRAGRSPLQASCPLFRPGPRLASGSRGCPARGVAVRVRRRRAAGGRAGLSHVLAQVLVRRGLGDPAARARVPGGGDAPSARAFGGLRDAAGRILGHVGAARGSPSTATTTSTASARPRCSCGCCARSAPTSTGTCPSRIDDGYGLARGDRRAARRARHGPADHGRLRDHRGRGGRARARAAGMDVVVTDHHSPRADGALPDAPLVHPRSAATRAPTCAPPASRTSSRRRCWRARGRTRRWPTRTSTSSRSPRSPTSCRCRARTGASSARACARSPRPRKPGLRALMDVARVDPSALDARRDRLPARPAAERRRAAATAPTRGSSCC